MIDTVHTQSERRNNIYISTIRLLCLLFLIIAPAQFIKATHNTQPPKYEVRAVWLTTIGGLDWPHNYAQSNRSIERQKQELRSILDKLQLANINTVILQTRIRGTVIYPSRYEPWDGCLSGIPGKSPGYDPLKFAIDECHRRGMEFQAWIVAIPVGEWDSFGCKRLRQTHPGLIFKIGKEGYMSPGSPNTADYISDICEEITRNYDIDGINLDYIRYPETWNKPISHDIGRANITRVVREVHDKIKGLKPWVKISCSPIGKFKDLSRYSSNGWNAYDRVMQDAQGWLRLGLMDELFPMMYFTGNQFFPFAIDWAEQSNQRIIAPGLGIYRMSPNEDNWQLTTITREMKVLRQYNMGHAFFRTGFFNDNLKGIYNFTANEFDTYPALIPPMKWERSVPPTPPTNIKERVDGGVLTLSWQGAKDNSGAPYLLYNIYSSHDYPVNTNDSRNLIVARTMDNYLKIDARPMAGNRYYAITAIDRYGNESGPIQADKQPKASNHAVPLLRCDNNKVTLQTTDRDLRHGVVAVETLQNTIIATRSYENYIIDVRNINDGFYCLYSIKPNGTSHRLGYFMIKRVR